MKINTQIYRADIKLQKGQYKLLSHKRKMKKKKKEYIILCTFISHA